MLLDFNTEHRPFQAKLLELVLKKADMGLFDLDYSVKFYASWRTKASMQGSKKPPTLSEYLDFNDEDDYEGILGEIRSTYNVSKTGLDKNVLCILAMVTAQSGSSGIQCEDSAILELSSPTRKTVRLRFWMFLTRRRRKPSMKS